MISQLAEKRFSKKTMINEYIKLYDRGTKKERILLIDVNCKYSSTGKIVYDLFNYLNNDGRKASVCYGRGEKIDEKGIFKFGIDVETYVHAILSRILGYNGCYSFFSTLRLIRYIEKFKPDLIHIHELHAYFVNIKMLLSYLEKKGIPIIWTFHCEYMYTGKCGHAYECQRYQTGCGNCPAVRDYPKSFFFDRTRSMYSWKKDMLIDLDFTIVTPSEWLKDRVKTSLLKLKEIKVIHNGIDTDVFKPQKIDEFKMQLGVPLNKKIVLAVAPDIMSANKGGKWVTKLAETMKDEAFFILVGAK